jgi:hypothetical protein
VFLERNIMITVGFEVLTVMVMKRSVFWDMVDFKQTTWYHIRED